MDVKALKRLRVERDLKQSEVGKKAKMPQQLISMFETGAREPSEEQYERLLKILTRVKR